MRRFGKALYVLMILLALMQISACRKAAPGNYSTNSEKDDTAVKELNERQISICEDVGLPTSYEKLTDSQKVKIDRIEELLSALDVKYGETFHYVGYYEAFLNDEEKIEAFSDRFNEYEYTTLTVQNDGIFIDDYPFQFVKRVAREDIINYLQEETGFEYNAYVVSGETSLTDIAHIEKSTLSGNAWVSFTVFVCGEKTHEESEKIGEALAGWYREIGIYGSTNVVAVKKDVFDEITFANYQSIKREQNLKNLLTCDVGASGNVTIK